MSLRSPIAAGTAAELAKKLLLARADPGDDVNPRGRAVFWIGAGASVSAGIPSGRALAGRLAVLLARKLGHICRQVAEDDPQRQDEAFTSLQRVGEVGRELTLAGAYGELFGRLDATQQRDFIRRVIVRTNRRQINWTHLALGELVRKRVVHTVLTTNFDDLALDGMVRCDQLPAIIDGVESLNRLDPRPPVPQLVYLHGSQHTYSPRNSTEAVLGTRDLAQARGGLFGLLQQCSVLTVIGYAGNPGEGVMEVLVQACRGLPELPIYWIAHGQQDSLSTPASELLSGARHARLIAGQDSDLFFRELLKEARIGVPMWFRHPVYHLRRLADRISVDTTPECAELKEEVDDFRARLFELEPVWLTVGEENRERRELRQLALADQHDAVWQRLEHRDLMDVTLLQTRAESAFELGRRGLQDLLPQAVRDWWGVLRQLPERSPEWALAQVRLGDTLAVMGERGDQRAVKDAIAAYGAALQVRTREVMPLPWASTRNNQGLALLTLGEWGDNEALADALRAFQDALDVYSRLATPNEWAATKSNLGNVLLVKGLRGDDRQLGEALRAYDEALAVQQLHRMPTDWAMTSCNRASALLALGQRGNETALKQAVRALDEASQVLARESAPADWATIKNNHGVALLALGQRGDEEALRRAIPLLREALEVRSAKGLAAELATTSNNLAGALLALGLRGDEDALHEAMGVLGNAMEVLSGEYTATNEHVDIEALAQHVLTELARVAARGPTRIPGIPGPPLNAPGTGSSRVIVVEDDPVQQCILEPMLRRCIQNVTIVLCTDGEAALRAIEAERADLVILDLHLPGMSGGQVLDRLRQAHPRLPVLVYSGDSAAIEQISRRPRGPQTVAVLRKDVAGIEDFTRVIPTLFKRRNGDLAGTPARQAAQQRPSP